MSEATYAAMREFIKVAVELETAKTIQPLREEIRSLKAELETRSASVVEGPPGKDGRDGEDGAAGERGKDGAATLEEIRAIAREEVETRAADINVRTFVDIYREIWKQGESYTRGNLVTWDGSMWLAKVDTQRKPGDKNADWKLIVKRGADR